MLIYKGMNVYPSAIREVVLSRFADAVTPYMRILKQREDQVRFDSPIPFEIEPQILGHEISGYIEETGSEITDRRQQHCVGIAEDLAVECIHRSVLQETEAGVTWPGPVFRIERSRLTV